MEGLREYEIIGLQIHNTLTFYINFPFEVEEFYYVWKNTLRTEEDTLVSYQPKSLVCIFGLCVLYLRATLLVKCLFLGLHLCLSAVVGDSSYHSLAVNYFPTFVKSRLQVSRALIYIRIDQNLILE